MSVQQAFELLRWRSHQTNTKLRDVSEQFVHEVTSSDMAPDLLRREVDHVLLTVPSNRQ